MEVMQKFITGWKGIEIMLKIRKDEMRNFKKKLDKSN